MCVRGCLPVTQPQHKIVGRNTQRAADSSKETRSCSFPSASLSSRDASHVAPDARFTLAASRPCASGSCVIAERYVAHAVYNDPQRHRNATCAAGNTLPATQQPASCCPIVVWRIGFVLGCICIFPTALGAQYKPNGATQQHNGAARRNSASLFSVSAP